MRTIFRFQISDFRERRFRCRGPFANCKFEICNLKSEIRRRRGFTLPELLMVITIIALLSSLGFSAYTGAIQLARQDRTRSMIDKIDALIMERFEGYRTRTVPIKIPASVSSSALGARMGAMMRLNAIRDLMRMEMPDRKSDVIDGPCDYVPFNPSPDLRMVSPALRQAYIRRGQRSVTGGPSNWPAGWTIQNQGSECLYLILSTMRDGDKAALDYFMAEEIGDTDGDGMLELLDSWGTPIQFIRWPAGYVPEGMDLQPGIKGTDDDGNGTVDDRTELGWPGSGDPTIRTLQTANYLLAPDPFDPVKVHAGTAPPTGPATLFGVNFTPGYLLHPLIISAGRDKKFDIVSDDFNTAYHYSLATNTNNYPNPYVLVSATIAGTSVNVPIGTVGDTDSDGFIDYADNISNHDQATQ